jgi:hypothetical protein
MSKSIPSIYTLWGIAFTRFFGYSVSQKEFLVGVIGWGWLWVILGVVLDLASSPSCASSNRNRFPEYVGVEKRYLFLSIERGP